MEITCLKKHVINDYSKRLSGSKFVSTFFLAWWLLFNIVKENTNKSQRTKNRNLLYKGDFYFVNYKKLLTEVDIATIYVV